MWYSQWMLVFLRARRGLRCAFKAKPSRLSKLTVKNTWKRTTSLVIYIVLIWCCCHIFRWHRTESMTESLLLWQRCFHEGQTKKRVRKKGEHWSTTILTVSAESNWHNSHILRCTAIPPRRCMQAATIKNIQEIYSQFFGRQPYRTERK